MSIDEARPTASAVWPMHVLAQCRQSAKSGTAGTTTKWSHTHEELAAGGFSDFNASIVFGSNSMVGEVTTRFFGWLSATGAACCAAMEDQRPAEDS